MAQTSIDRDATNPSRPKGPTPNCGQTSAACQPRTHDNVSVQSLDGDWSIFRREIVFGAKNVDRKHGPVPFRGARGTVPFSRRERQFSCDVLSAAKIGTVPCKASPLSIRLIPAGDGHGIVPLIVGHGRRVGVKGEPLGHLAGAVGGGFVPLDHLARVRRHAAQHRGETARGRRTSRRGASRRRGWR